LRVYFDDLIDEVVVGGGFTAKRSPYHGDSGHAESEASWQIPLAPFKSSETDSTLPLVASAIAGNAL
jgi:hypothetical protein